MWTSCEVKKEFLYIELGVKCFKTSVISMNDFCKCFFFIGSTYCMIITSHVTLCPIFCGVAKVERFNLSCLIISIFAFVFWSYVPSSCMWKAELRGFIYHQRQWLCCISYLFILTILQKMGGEGYIAEKDEHFKSCLIFFIRLNWWFEFRKIDYLMCCMTLNYKRWCTPL